MKDVYSLLFRFDEMTGKWHCFSRDDYRDYWNERTSISVGRAYSPEMALENYRTQKLN